MALKDKLTSRLAIKIYIVLSSLFILMFIADAWIMPALVHSRDEITIPDVTGKKAEAAMALLESKDLKPQIYDTASHPDIPPGHVAFQDPVANSVVREGRNVYLTVSGGEERIAMPNLRGRSLRDARITLEQMEFRIGKVSYEPSDLPAESVVSQNIAPGKRVPKNSVVEITVSGGSDIEVEIPYLVALSLDEAQQKLLESGLRLGKVSYSENSSFLPNTVLAQDPLAGDPIAPNGAVNLTVAH
ncbi:PASTA domain-containing protein [bacterium]|nr:PASTA domain-containing protein [bacterium]